MKMPLLISVPHAGLRVPPEAQEHCLLTPQQILADSDEEAGEIYDLESDAVAYVTTDVARAIVDMNRPENDRGRDGVVKTHTCYGAPVYSRLLGEDLVETLLERYHRPYHKRLSECAIGLRFGLDCHTMAAVGPPTAPDPGSDRPKVCLSDASGTCPPDLFDQFICCFEQSFGCEISVNHPFAGGHIIRSHCTELPWAQIELSRAPFLETREKHNRVLDALTLFCRTALRD